MSTTELAAALRDKTRTSVAHEAHARAHDRCMELGIQLRAAFDALIRARDDLAELGIETNVSLDPPLSHAWAEYGVQHQLDERRESDRRAGLA